MATSIEGASVNVASEAITGRILFNPEEVQDIWPGFGSRLLPRFDEFFSGLFLYENFLFSWLIYFRFRPFYLRKSQNSLEKIRQIVEAIAR